MRSGAPTLAVISVCLMASTMAAQGGGDWAHPDHDLGGRRFSPLKQITPANVATLQVAWAVDTGATGIEVTPIVAGGLMYITAGSKVMALEPETGTVVWTFTAPAAVSRRGAAYWPGDAATPARLIFACPGLRR
jgi:glucose dehydrogenase